MREILFRGKRVDNGEWVLGMPCSDLRHGVDAIQAFNGGIYDIIPETVGQFTGLTDRNGTKIFEGDVVTPLLPENDFPYEEVCIGDFTADDYYSCYGVFTKSKDEYADYGSVNNRLVAGNIFDNADLLNKPCTWGDWDLLRNKKGAK